MKTQINLKPHILIVIPTFNNIRTIESVTLDAVKTGYDLLIVNDGSDDGTEKSIDKLSNNPLQGAVISSDGFFPFRDSIDLIAKYGITAVIQPGGSMRDFEVIKAVNECGISMILTMERCFGHF